MKDERVGDWMTSHVITITSETTLPEAEKIMRERGVRRLPVVDKGRLVGIVTRGDIREAQPSDATSLSIWEINYLLWKLKVKDFMTRSVQTIGPEASIGDAAALMLADKISGVPVVDKKGAVVGILTESDIFRLVVRHWREGEKEN